MNRSLLLVALSAALVGCVAYAPTKPDGYVGPTAYTRDSTGAQETSKVEMFYLSMIDGKKIFDSRAKNIDMNLGKGFRVSSVTLDHEIPARPTKLTIVGLVHYGAPILAMANPDYKVEGVIDLVPEPGKIYVVRGKLGADASEVWLEEDMTGKVLGRVRAVHKK